MNDAELPGESRFLTLADVAEVLNVSASQTYALVRSGELPAIKVGGHGHWRVERSMLERYIQDKYEESRRIGKCLAIGLYKARSEMHMMAVRLRSFSRGRSRGLAALLAEPDCGVHLRLEL